ncbi:MAG: hypothetical protein WA728_32640, partial [Xanthobacteraceae bacterium]
RKGSGFAAAPTGRFSSNKLTSWEVQAAALARKIETEYPVRSGAALFWSLLLAFQNDPYDRRGGPLNEGDCGGMEATAATHDMAHQRNQRSRERASPA